MKKIILAASALALGSVAAHAADGTITINGMVTDQTCTINDGTEDIIVNLPTVGTSALAAGQTAGRTPFTISLTDCSDGKVATYFEPGAHTNADGYLNNTVVTQEGATNVQVQLLGDNNEVIKVLAGAVQPNSQEVTVANGSADLNYYAQYFATGTATAGEVSTSVQYSIVYP